MKRLYSLLVVLLPFVLSPAQNLLHYAISSNGEKGDCLFPEDEAGNVVFSSIIDVPCSADSIMLIVDDYISAQNISEKCVVNNLSKSSRTSTYSIQLNIGKQLWGVEYWGSPLFVFARDASHVKFKCIIEARNGKYKYSLVDFETNRRTIRGAAKNDGQPNVIHWQRVNSLTKEKMIMHQKMIQRSVMLKKFFSIITLKSLTRLVYIKQNTMPQRDLRKG